MQSREMISFLQQMNTSTTVPCVCVCVRARRGELSLKSILSVIFK